MDEIAKEVNGSGDARDLHSLLSSARDSSFIMYIVTLFREDDVHKMETDGSVVCISEKKGQEDSDVQRLLWRRSIIIFRKKEDFVEMLEKNENGSKKQHQKVERVRVKDNAFVGRSVKIDVVDDTALLNVVPFCKKGKDHHPKRSGAAHSDDKEALNKPERGIKVEWHRYSRFCIGCTKMKPCECLCTLSRDLEKPVKNRKKDGLTFLKGVCTKKECGFSLCYCPAPNCSYAGVYKRSLQSFDANHKDAWNRFVCGFIHTPCLSTGSKIAVLQEHKDGSLVVLQCFELPQGMSVTVNRIAPSAPGVGKFSFSLTYSMGRHTMTFGSREMNRIQRVSFQTPQDNFMLIPSFLNPPLR
ncbi:TRAF-like protein [Raphanus sativus]|nr:TRAF-like protein [Raphanus sativus]